MLLLPSKRMPRLMQTPPCPVCSTGCVIRRRHANKGTYVFQCNNVCQFHFISFPVTHALYRPPTLHDAYIPPSYLTLTRKAIARATARRRAYLLRRWRLTVRVFLLIRPWHARAIERVYAPGGSGYMEVAADFAERAASVAHGTSTS